MTPDLDRFVGCLVGAALGDAFGAPYEFAKGPVLNISDHFQRGVFRTDPGYPTDDSTLVGILADVLWDCRQLDQKEYLRRLVEWRASDPPDIGSTTMASITHFERTGELPPMSASKQGNGAVMAVAPIGLLHAGDPDLAEEVGSRFSMATHPSIESMESCGVVARAISQLVCGQEPDKGLTVPVSWKPDGPEMGWCKGTAFLALSTLIPSTDPADAMKMLRATIQQGGDTDTNACVAGALLGARFGMAAWPQHLVEMLYVGAEMASRAGMLYALAVG